MPRYGGGQEDFAAQQRRLAQMQERLASIEAKERAATSAMEDLGAAEEQATVRRRTLSRAKQEGLDITQREAAVGRQEASAVDIDTAAIERNRIARERRAAAARQEQINVNRALRGAGDPLFGAASASGVTSQYGLRQQFGVGQQRAQRLQEAINASFVRPGGPEGAVGASTRLQAAQQGVVAADIQYAETRRAYAAAVRQGDEAAAQRAYAEREAATNARQAAKTELQSAEEAAASAVQLAAARREAADATRIAAAREAQAAVVGGSQAIIVHPTAATGVLTSKEGVERGIQPGLAAAQAQAAASAATRARAASLEAEASRLGLTTDAERAYVASLTAEQRELIALSAASSATAREQVAARSLSNAGALRQEGVALSTVSQAMHKHGALTQEFVLATARGETTLRELGSQAIITAGKFGGWTAAATALFGAARAIGEIGKGAIQAQSGVSGLQRFIPNLSRDQAIRGFQQVSQEVNVPIQDVAQTQQIFARVFQNQHDSLIATSTALKAYQLDQVDAADSARYFTAIIQEGRVPAERLPLLFDQISAAQRRFGARVSENLPAIARSLAAVKNAGGDINQLIALTSTAQTASGQTGNVVGTAFSRAASNFFRQPANQEVIRSLGLDPNEGFTQLLIDAVHRTKELPGADRIKLAKAIGGPQYGGRIFQALLNQPERLDKALRVTAPAAAAGSTEDELRQRLSQVDQQVNRLGISLQNLGAAISQSGAFVPLGLMLHLLNDTLSTAVKLVDVFDHLPGPIREALSVAAELALVIKVLQRFGATERLAGTPLGFLANPDRQTATKARAGLRGARDEAFNVQESTQRRAYNLRNSAASTELAAQRAVADEAELAASITTRTAESDEALLAAQQRVVTANAQAERMAVQAAAAAQEAADARVLAAQADEEYVAAARLSHAELVGIVRQQNVPVPVELKRPSTQGVEGGPGAPIIAPATRTSEADIRKAQREADRLDSSRMTTRARNLQRNLEGYWSSVGTSVAEMGVAGRAIDRAAISTIGVAAKVESGVEGAAVATTAAGGRLKALAASLGVLDYAFLALIAIPILGDQFSKAEQGARDTLKNLKSTPHSGAAYKAQVDRAVRVLDDQAGTGRQLAEAGAALGDRLTHFDFGHLLDRTPQAQARDRAAKIIQQHQALQQQQARESSAGQPITGLYSDDLVRAIQRDASDRRAGVISQRQFDHLMANHRVEVAHLLGAGTKELNAAYQALASAYAGENRGQALRKALAQLDAKGLQQFIESRGTEIQTYGASPALLLSIRTAYATAEHKYGGSQDAGDIAALGQARESFWQIQKDSSDEDLKLALSNAATEGDRQAAYRAEQRALRTNILGGDQGRLQLQRQRVTAARQALNAARQAERAYAQASGEFQTATSPNEFGVPSLGEAPRSATQAAAYLRQKVQDARDRRDQLLRQLGIFDKGVQAATRHLNDLINEARDNAYEDRQTGRQIALEYRQSQTSSTGGRDAAAVENAARNVADANRTYHRNTAADRRRRIQAQTVLNQARLQQAQDAKQEADQARQDATQYTDLVGQLAVARAGEDAVAAAQASQRVARNALAHATTRNERLQALINLVQANNQLTSAIRDREDARYDYLESLTTDPVKLADIETRRAKAGIHGRAGSADRYRTQATYQRALQSRRDAHLQAKEDDIDFERQMGKLSISDAITRYEDLLRIHNLTKAQRRDIRLKIHQLQQDAGDAASGFDLDVGSLRLPTLFDARKAFDPIRKQIIAQRKEIQATASQTGGFGYPGPYPSDVTHNIRSNVNHLHDMRGDVQARINVYVSETADAEKVYTAIDKALGTHVRARMRSRGKR